MLHPSLDNAAAWYEAERSGMGVKLVADLQSTLALLCALPNIGWPAVNTRGGSDARVWRLGRKRVDADPEACGTGLTGGAN